MADDGGLIPFVGTWSGGTFYQRNDCVLRSGVLYQARTNRDDGRDPTAGAVYWADMSAVVATYTGSIDPTAGGGIPAAVGSTYQRSGTGLYIKSDTGATDWDAAGAGGGGLPTGWTQSEVDGSVDAGGQDFYAGNISASGALVTSGGLVTLNGIEILKLTSDPTSGGGQSAALGSLGLRSNGQAWLKTGSGNTDWTQVGGVPAGQVKVVRVPIAFDTANLVLTGITAYTPAAGDVLLDTSYLSITTDWDGSTPGIYLYSAGDDTSSEAIVSHFGLQSANTPDGGAGGVHRGIVAATMGAMYLNASSGQHIALNDTTVLKLMIDDGAAGDPVSTQGEGVFVLIIAPAS